MHISVKETFRIWYDGIPTHQRPSKIAYLGSYDCNGSITDLVNCVGFDIVRGPGVDVQIKNYQIPEEHKNKYDLVVSISAFHCCPFPETFMHEIIDLLEPEGHLFLTTCGWECRFIHTSSPSTIDSIRIRPHALARLFNRAFDIYDMTQIKGEAGHSDTLLIAKKRN